MRLRNLPACSAVPKISNPTQPNPKGQTMQFRDLPIHATFMFDTEQSKRTTYRKASGCTFTQDGSDTVHTAWVDTPVRRCAQYLG